MGAASHNSGVCELLQKSIVHFCVENYTATADIEIDAIICLSVKDSSQQNVIKVHKVVPKHCFKNTNNSNLTSTTSKNDELKHQLQLKKKKKQLSRQNYNLKRWKISQARQKVQNKCQVKHKFNSAQQQNNSYLRSLLTKINEPSEETRYQPSTISATENTNSATDVGTECNSKNVCKDFQNVDPLLKSSLSFDRDTGRSVCVVDIKSEPDNSSWYGVGDSTRTDKKSVTYCEQNTTVEQTDSAVVCSSDSEQYYLPSTGEDASTPSSMDKMYMTIESDNVQEKSCEDIKGSDVTDRCHTVSQDSESLDYIFFEAASESVQQGVSEEKSLSSANVKIKREPRTIASCHDDVAVLSPPQDSHIIQAKEPYSSNKKILFPKTKLKFELSDESPSFENSDKYMQSTETDRNHVGFDEFHQHGWSSANSQTTITNYDDSCSSGLRNDYQSFSTQPYTASASFSVGTKSLLSTDVSDPRKCYPLQHCSLNVKPDQLLSSTSKLTSSPSTPPKSNFINNSLFSPVIWKSEEKSLQKKFFCEKCGTGFTCKKSKMRHIKHTCGSKTFECSICGKSYSRSDSKQRHMWKMHGLKTQYFCPKLELPLNNSI